MNTIIFACAYIVAILNAYIPKMGITDKCLNIKKCCHNYSLVFKIPFYLLVFVFIILILIGLLWGLISTIAIVKVDHVRPYKYFEG